MKRTAPLTLLFLAAGCSWSRFDDVLENPPVELMDRSGAVSAAFGTSLAGADGELLVGGEPNLSGAALHAVTDQKAADSARGLCTDPFRCRLIRWPAATNRKSGCIAYGVGPGTAGGDVGVLVACPGDVDQKLVIPKPFADALQPLFMPLGVYGDRVILSLAEADGLVAAVSPAAQLVWTYPPGQTMPSPGIQKPASAHVSFGSAIALTRGATPRIAVAAPEVGEVYVYDVAGDKLTLRGCAKKGADWGKVMVGLPDGRVAVTTGASPVDILDTAKITDAGCKAATPEVTLPCVESEHVSGCDSSRFGASLATGDLDGDGDLELVVGAPGMTVDDEAGAGAVLVFDLEASNAPADWLFVAESRSNDGLGTAVATTRVGSRDLVAATQAQNRQQTAVFYCSVLGGAGKPSSRCQ